MSPLHKLYFDMVHKIITPRKKRYTKASFLNMTLIELLDTEVKIRLAHPSNLKTCTVYCTKEIRVILFLMGSS